MNAFSKPSITYDQSKSPFQAVQNDYARKGFHVLPIGHGSKQPATEGHGKWAGMPGWRDYATTPPDEDRRGAWGRMRDARGNGPGIGLLLNTPAGAAPDGSPCVTVALDFDPSKDCRNEAAVLAALRNVLPEACAKRGAKGATLLARIRRADCAKGYDYAAADGSKLQLLLNAQTVMPPSIHPETEQPYQWLGDAILPRADELPLVELAALDAAMREVGYTRGGSARHDALGDADLENAAADIAIGEERPNLIAELDAATGRLGDLWRGGADAPFMRQPKADGGPRDISGSGLRLELARQMRRAGYNGAEFDTAARLWPHAAGKHLVRDRDIVRAWASGKDGPGAGAGLTAVEDAGDVAAGPRPGTIEARLAEYPSRYPKVIHGGEVRLAVTRQLVDGGVQTDLIAPPKFPPFAPGDWVEVTEGKRLRRVHLVTLYMQQETPLLAGLCFLPGLPQRDCPDWLNTWRGWGVEPAVAGSCEQFKQHLRERVCSGDGGHFAYLWRWMAHMVQLPRVKPGAAVVLQGGKGCGKSIVGDVLGRLVGHQHRAVVKDREHVLGRFNGHLSDALLIQIEEAVWARDPKGEGVLKSLITEANMTVERKGIDAFPAESFCRVLITSNEDFVVPATVGERRFLMLRMANSNIAGPIVKTMLAELEAGGYARLMRELREADLTGFDPMRPPATAALAEQIAENLPPVEEWFAGERDGGELWQMHAGDECPVRVPGQQLRTRFDRWRSAQRVGPVSAATWGRDLRRLGCVHVKAQAGNLWQLPARAEVDPAN